MQDVTIFPGRFQPFHSGHLKCCEDIYKKNGNPVVILYITNKKFDKKKPFDDELTKEELEIVKKNNDFIADIFWIRNPLAGPMIALCNEHGYNPTVWIAGEDRLESYQKMLDGLRNPDIHKPELIETNRYCSATEVRDAILKGDKKTFEKLMPKGTVKLWEKYKKQIDKVYNTNETYIGLADYIAEQLRSN
ncbi:MAG: adenylyltransferase/cytidyltransferase family protein [Erysipelotrichales bacterium]|nr:adenylyltransferase/cytidyltransferase family protein [Erysipelotrichales bacterium]